MREAPAMVRPTLAPHTAAAVVAALHGSELRLTRHREAVLAVLDSSDRPLTTDEIVRRSAVPTSTAYRNLAELVEVGVVVRISGLPGGDRHELAEAFTRGHHHHLVCTHCGLVTDFDPSTRLERLIAQEVRELLDASGFEASDHVFDVRGRCRDCAATA